MKMTKKFNLDFWSIVKVLIFLFIILTIIYPLSIVFVRSVTDATGNLTIKNFVKFFSTPYYLDSLKNSLFVSGTTTFFCIIVGVWMAYVTTRFDIKAKKLINIIVILSLMSPPFIGAYSWIILFGRSGFVTKLLLDFTGIAFPTIYGKWGIVSIFTLKMFPYVYLFTSGALSSIDGSLEEAGENLGAHHLRRVFTITFPVVAPSIFAGAIMVFMSCISDFGTPMLIGQNYKVLATLVYEQYMSELGTSANFASAVSMIIVVLCALILVGQKSYLNSRNYAMTSMYPPKLVHLMPLKRFGIGIILFIILFISMLPQIVVIVTSFKNTNGPYFIDGWGFESYTIIFTRMMRSIKNTYYFSFVAMIFMVIIGSLTAYVTVRKRSLLTGFMDILLMVPYVLPGAVMALGLIIGFNRYPLWLAGTAFIMILSFTVRKIPYTVRSGVGFLYQMDPNVDEASINLGVSPGLTFLKITVPIMLPGILSGAILSWIETINELSSSVMLYTGRTSTIAVAIFSEVARNSFGTAAAMATILTVTTVVMLLIFSRVSRGRVSIV
jgi:iron(III) transport system permease protein